ncbi:hotdog fold thioesterase [Spongiibacter taiwanensis]|uniref:PaaI family thioesterase n=1 Tax=Spongiibacter taiwanensis TaxID=1748242 RepID=UPI002036344D|nr:hotdog domain-containing protein [Spongiibacter taiwanensis]USA44007.1 hotdog fold thioesterase [Spongiibacter taiwanensis]
MAVNLDELLRFNQVMTSTNEGDHFLTVGIKIDDLADKYVRGSMDYSPAIIGDPETGIIHGGPITSLLDTTAGFAAGTQLESLGFTPTIDLRIDYMRPATPGEQVIAEAEVYRSTEFVFFTRAVAHHGDPERPIAHATGNFFNLGPGAFNGVREVFELAESGKRPRPAYLDTVAEFDPNTVDLCKDQVLMDFVQRIPYVNTLGMLVLAEPGCYQLPPKQSNIGNPSFPALHGGAIAGFMEMSAIVSVLRRTGTSRVPRVIDISVDYLRAGGFKNTYVRCKVNYLGQRMVNVSVTAWQDREEKPIANARAQFLLKD